MAMTGTQRQVLTTTCLAHSLIHIYELSIPALLWMIQTEFGANDLEERFAREYQRIAKEWFRERRAKVTA